MPASVTSWLAPPVKVGWIGRAGALWVVASSLVALTLVLGCFSPGDESPGEIL
jgi:hypothetical protein